MFFFKKKNSVDPKKDMKDRFSGDQTRSRHGVVDADLMPGIMVVVDQR